ncbi:QueT transporter family protein [Risungbinella massiliensis]|uniref:QueT transporter family protein n=1 Tax=Risungbinella massiliensis TaxID=1329796 RepID=UPI0005CBC349|nr:QueT transporter family protein [Risungbinella massiliensis]
MTAKKITIIAVIAALYAALTLAFAPISYGALQFRISEALTVLPFFTPLAIPGLTLGTFIANMQSSFAILDMVIGSIATLIAATLTYKVRKKWLAPLPPVIMNALIIGTMISILSNYEPSIPVAIAYVGLGQLGVCYLLGYPLLLVLEKYRNQLPFASKK